MLGAGPAGRGAAGCCRSPPAPLRRCWPGTRPAQIPFCEGRGRRAGLERRARSGRGVEQGQGVSGLPDRPLTPAPPRLPGACGDLPRVDALPWEAAQLPEGVSHPPWPCSVNSLWVAQRRRSGLASPQAVCYPVEDLGQERPDEGVNCVKVPLFSAGER